MLSNEEILKIVEKLKNSDINIKKTIEKATTAGYLGEKHFYCTVLEDGGSTHTIPEILGDRYKSQPLDNLYYDIVSKALIWREFTFPLLTVAPIYSFRMKTVMKS